MAKRSSNGKRMRKRLISFLAAKDQRLDKPRRSALKQLGRFGAYTAPAILAMSWSDKAAAVSLSTLPP